MLCGVGADNDVQMIILEQAGHEAPAQYLARGTDSEVIAVDLVKVFVAVAALLPVQHSVSSIVRRDCVPQQAFYAPRASAEPRNGTRARQCFASSSERACPARTNALKLAPASP